MYHIISEILSNNHLKITNEMVDWFEERTFKHIDLVKKYAKIISEKFSSLSKVLEQSKNHDDSKFQEPERTPYVFISWQYKMKDDGKEFVLPLDIQNKMNIATKHHVITNRHHPEFHVKDKNVELINRNDRDRPLKDLIDATTMSDIDIAEMCADWCAMSEEKGNSPQEWAKKNIGIRWKFTDKQKDLIYKILNNIF